MQEHQKQVASVASTDTANHQKRNKLLATLIMVVLVAGLLTFAYWKLVASRHITTNNAYASADIAHVTPSTGGTIKSINVFDTQTVKAGDILVTLEDTDAQFALEQARANFARSEADLDRVQKNYGRRAKLVVSGFVSTEEMNHVEIALKIAKANLSAAAVNLEKAKVELNRTTIRAPLSGIVAKRDAQLGQRVAAGTYLLSIVPVTKIYVNANFKEVQLRKVKIGQPVTAHADIYGSRVTYHGKVIGLAGGTGAAFAIIPAQNATGNWIKVVQRLPVRVELDSKDLIKHPLKVGLSMDVDIHLG